MIAPIGDRAQTESRRLSGEEIWQKRKRRMMALLVLTQTQ
jgi:accessory gene regulator protein AgrB